MHRIPTGLLVLVLLLGCTTRGNAQSRPLWTGLEPGSHDTGFKRVWTTDPVRVWPRSAALDSREGDVARPIRLDVWYPARCGAAARRMVLRDYLEMAAPSPVFEDLVFLTHRWDEYSYRGLAVDSASFDRLMATPTAGCFDAPAADGSFPLVVYSAGWFNRAPDNTILAEFLASHGYVVVAIPQLNPGLWTFEFASDARSVENQVRDLQVAISELGRDPLVDRRRIAAMGYSTGGDVALLVAGRNPLVDAVVGLDGSWSLGPGNDVIESSLFRPSEHTKPILALRRPTENTTGADEVLDSLSRAPRLVVEIPGGDHGTFSDDPSQRRVLGTDTPEHEATHRLMSRAVLLFLNAALKSDMARPAELVDTYRGMGLKARYRAPKPNG